MSSLAQVSPELEDCLSRLQLLLGHYLVLINVLIATTIKHEAAKDLRKETNPLPAKVVEVLPHLLQAIGSSSNTLTQLSYAPGLHTRDCYTIARSIVETAVNVCYIMAEGNDIAERALRHARQKSYRDLERESKIGETILRLSFLGRPDPSSIQGLEADIAEFTSRTGREKGWTELNIDDRIRLAGQKLGEDVLVDLLFARFGVYRHASEILHGTFFSALYFFGATQPSNESRSPQQAKEFIGQQHMVILFATIQALSAIVKAFHRAFGFSTVHERSEALIKSLMEIKYFQEPKDSTQSD